MILNHKSQKEESSSIQLHSVVNGFVTLFLTTVMGKSGMDLSVCITVVLSIKEVSDIC